MTRALTHTEKSKGTFVKKSIKMIFYRTLHKEAIIIKKNFSLSSYEYYQCFKLPFKVTSY